MIDKFWTSHVFSFLLVRKGSKIIQYLVLFFGHENLGCVFQDFGLQSRQSAPGFLSSSSNWVLPITFPPNECVSPLGPKGGEQAHPIPTKGQTLWYSKYNLPEGKKRRPLKTALMCCFMAGFCRPGKTIMLRSVGFWASYRPAGSTTSASWLSGERCR